MEQANPPRKTLFIFVWGVLGWGFSTVLVMTLFDWYTTRRMQSRYEVVSRFVLFMAVGGLWGERIGRWRDAVGRKKLTNAGSIILLVLFTSLILALAIALWATTHH
jgi:hypothetical protein